MQKKIVFKSLFTAITTLLSVFCSSCRDDKTGIEMQAKLYCSSDLLEFVDPVLTLTTTDGIQETFNLSADDFIHGAQSTFINNIDYVFNDQLVGSDTDTIKVRKDYALCPGSPLWTDNDKMSAILTLSFKIKPGVEITRNMYYFDYSVVCKYKTYVDGKSSEPEEIKTDLDSGFISKSDVESYLKDLQSKTIQVSIEI